MEDNYYKEIMINYSLILILCLFLVVYMVINYSVIQEGNIYGGDIPKTIIITGIIFIILYIFLTWEDNDNAKEENANEEEFVIPKYKIINKINIRDNETKELSKVNNYNTKYKKDFPVNKQENFINKQENFINKQENSINKQENSDKVENSNIFVPQKNKAKFGIKF
jgi:hypothetical protein